MYTYIPYAPWRAGGKRSRRKSGEVGARIGEIEINQPAGSVSVYRWKAPTIGGGRVAAARPRSVQVHTVEFPCMTARAYGASE